MPVAAAASALTRRGLQGITWNAIINWTIEDVFAEIADAELALHEAYTKYGASRVSCAYCIMSSLDDLRAAAGCADNHDVYRAMVELEAASSFAFQGQRWLADVAPHLLPDSLKAAIVRAKAAAQQRHAIEAELPAHLFFTAGWPTAHPTFAEATLIADVRRRVASTLAFVVAHTDAHSVIDRYDALLAARHAKQTPAPRAPDAIQAIAPAKATQASFVF